nr:hypothetical protein [Mycoplasmopsis bovis]
MKRDKIKKLSILTFSPLSVVSTFAIISASCEFYRKGWGATGCGHRE